MQTLWIVFLAVGQAFSEIGSLTTSNVFTPENNNSILVSDVMAPGLNFNMEIQKTDGQSPIIQPVGSIPSPNKIDPGHQRLSTHQFKSFTTEVFDLVRTKCHGLNETKLSQLQLYFADVVFKVNLDENPNNNHVNDKLFSQLIQSITECSKSVDTKEVKDKIVNTSGSQNQLKDNGDLKQGQEVSSKNLKYNGKGQNKTEEDLKKSHPSKFVHWIQHAFSSVKNFFKNIFHGSAKKGQSTGDSKSLEKSVVLTRRRRSFGIPDILNNLEEGAMARSIGKHMMKQLLKDLFRIYAHSCPEIGPVNVDSFKVSAKALFKFVTDTNQLASFSGQVLDKKLVEMIHTCQHIHL